MATSSTPPPAWKKFRLLGIVWIVGGALAVIVIGALDGGLNLSNIGLFFVAFGAVFSVIAVVLWSRARAGAHN